MAIQGSTTISAPAQTYDQWWIQRLIISAPNPSLKATAQVVLIPMSSATGSVNLGGAVPIVISDLLGLVGTNTEVAAAFAALETAIQNIAISQGKI